MRTRTINVTDGAAEYVTARLDEIFDKPIAGATFQVGLGTYTAPPTTWKAADAITTDVADPSVVHVSMLVNNTVTPRTKARMWVKMTDAPETLVRLVDGVDLTIA